MEGSRVWTWMYVVVWLACSGAVHAQNSFEDLRGRFSLDLPEGWKLVPQENEYVYVFKGKGIEQVVVFFDPDARDRAKLFSQAEETLRVSLPNAAPEGAVVDLEVNGNPARWGVYRGTTEAGSPKVVVALVGLLGSVVLREGGIYFLSVLNDNSRKQWGEKLQKVFQSIREAGASPTGVGEARVAQPAGLTSKETAPAPTPGQPSAFTHQHVSLTLPPGWSSQPVAANLEDGTVGKFSSARTSATFVVGCTNVVKKWFMKKKSLQTLHKESKSVIESAMPTAVSAEGPFELVTADGKKAFLEVYKGSLVVEGKELPMHAVAAAAKTEQCSEGLTMYGFVASSSAGTAVPEMKQIVQSVR